MKKCLLAAILGLLLLLNGCAPIPKDREDILHLFYEVSIQEAGGGDIIESVPVDWSAHKTKDTQQQAEEMLWRLLMGDRQEGLLSPMPAGTMLRGCRVSGGTVWVDFSSAYGQLSGMELTIADYCVTLSLTQLAGVYAVRITVNGQELPYRDAQQFTAADALLTSSEDVMRSMVVRLYFPDSSGQLRVESRTLAMYEGESPVQHLLQALQDGPTQENLTALLPENFAALGIWMDEEICCLNLEAQQLEQLSPVQIERMLRGLTMSLGSISSVREVQFLVNGKIQKDLAGIDISQPMKP